MRRLGRRSRRPTGPTDPPRSAPASDGPAGTLHALRMDRTTAASRALTDDELLGELGRRLADGTLTCGEEGGPLLIDLEAVADNEENRFSRARLRSQFSCFVGQFYGRPLEGTTFVELGCGDQNPLAVLFMFVLLGAREGIGIDLQRPQDEALAARGLARVAELMLADPQAIVGDHPITRSQIAANVGAFDIRRLRAGDLGGIDGERLRLVQRDVADTGLPAECADYVFSTSVLEHVPDLDAVLAEARRITHRRGWGWHVHDGVDHAVYEDPQHPPLAFLREPLGPALVHGSNRIRPLELPARFAAAGFTTMDTHPNATEPVTAEERATFAEPWRSMDDETLAVRGALFFVRRS